MPTYRKLSGVHYHRPASGGSLVRYVPGDTITVEFEAELGSSLDTWERTSPSEPEPGPVYPLEIVHLGRGRYNVCKFGTDDPINDEPLTLADARSVLGDPDAAARRPLPKD